MFGSSCVKFGCPFKHPSSRPTDCPDGEHCDKAKCPLHHPKTRQIKQYEPHNPCALSFSGMRKNVTPRRSHGHVSRFTPRMTPRFTPRMTPRPSLRDSRTLRVPRVSSASNRLIVRSPMVIPTPNSRPITGYFAATLKSCAHGASCTNYGCTYKHPASRAAECDLGTDCEHAECTRLHPLNVNGTGAADAGFVVGQKVQAKFLPTSIKWSDATIHRIRGSALTLQFSGFEDAFEVPLRRLRLAQTDEPHTNRPPTPPLTPPPNPSSLSDLQQLECLKQAAVAREDFVAAQQVKQRIDVVKRVAELQKQKQKAVAEENFLLAMQLKQQIAKLDVATPGHGEGEGAYEAK